MQNKNLFKQDTSREVAKNKSFFKAIAGLVGLAVLVVALVLVVGAGNKDKPKNTVKTNQGATTPPTLSDIRSQYTQDLLSDSAFVKKVQSTKGGQMHDIAASDRKPIEFTRWDHDGDGEESLVVANKFGNDARAEGYEVILFEVSDDNVISEPRRLWHDSGGGGIAPGSIDIAVNAENNLQINAEFFSANQTYPRKVELSYEGGEFLNREEKEYRDLSSLAYKARNAGLNAEDIESQYSEELFSKLPSGRRIEKRTLRAFTLWDHDNDGRDSLAALNTLMEKHHDNKEGSFRVILFELDGEKISNPQIIFSSDIGSAYRNNSTLEVANPTSSTSALKVYISWGGVEADSLEKRNIYVRYADNEFTTVFD